MSLGRSLRTKINWTSNHRNRSSRQIRAAVNLELFACDFKKHISLTRIFGIQLENISFPQLEKPCVWLLNWAVWSFTAKSFNAKTCAVSVPCITTVLSGREWSEDNWFFFFSNFISFLFLWLASSKKFIVFFFGKKCKFVKLFPFLYFLVKPVVFRQFFSQWKVGGQEVVSA